MRDLTDRLHKHFGTAITAHTPVSRMPTASTPRACWRSTSTTTTISTASCTCSASRWTDPQAGRKPLKKGVSHHEGTKDTKVLGFGIWDLRCSGFLSQRRRGHRVFWEYCSGFFTRRREDARAGGRVSPRAAFRCAEGWSQVPSQSTGRDERRSSAGKQTLAPPSASQADAKSWSAAAGWRAKMGNFVALCAFV